MTAKYSPVINYSRCKQCGLCVAFCPKEVFTLDRLGKPEVSHPELCIGCALCCYRCPDIAINIEEDAVEIQE